jgi:TolB-like protein
MRPEPGLSIDADAVVEQLERILSSKTFATARRSQMLLRYVVERTLANSAPKEYEIAVGVLGRDDRYDPEIDATVRVEASRLRGRLREYYDTVGETDPILIEIPKGRYAAVFERRKAPTQPGIETSSPPQTVTGPDLPPAPRAPVRWVGHWWVVLAIGVIGVLCFWFLSGNRKVHGAGPIRSLAVLPLQNLSKNADEEYFADGMTDALITEFARMPNLRVVSRTSVMQEKGSKKSLRQIASELDVDAIVEGSVVRSGGHVRITAQLIDARNDTHLWARSFEEPMSDVLTLQDNMVREIAAQAQSALAPPVETGNAEHINPAAYDAYLRGLYFLDLRNGTKSAMYFRQAISLDASYPAAYSGLAQALTSERVLSQTKPPDTEVEAFAAAQRAIRLTPKSGDGYTALGFAEMTYRKDWSSAGRDLQKGIALSPNDSLAELEYAIYLDAVGRPEDAVSHMRHAVKLDPLSFLMNRHLGSTLYFARHYQEALLYFHRAAEMEPRNFRLVDNWLSRSFEMLGDLDEAERADLMVLGALSPGANLAPLRLVYSRHGWRAYQAARIRLLSTQPALECGSFEIGESYLRIGDRDQAVSWIGRGLDTSCFWGNTLVVDPVLDDLRTDPHYPALLERINSPVARDALHRERAPTEGRPANP